MICARFCEHIIAGSTVLLLVLVVGGICSLSRAVFPGAGGAYSVAACCLFHGMWWLSRAVFSVCLVVVLFLGLVAACAGFCTALSLCLSNTHNAALAIDDDI